MRIRFWIAALLCALPAGAANRVSVTVVDAKSGKPALGLKAEEFTLYEDKLARKADAAEFSSDIVDVMLMPVCAVGDQACQISAVPGMPLALVTRLHVRPPPLMVILWPPAAGPDDAANATTRSPADVLNGPAVLVPEPSANTIVPTARLPAGGVTVIVTLAVAVV